MPASYITVRVGRVPGTISEVTLDGGRKVRDAITAARLDATGCEIRVNDTMAGLDSDLNDRDTVFLLKKIRGAA